MSSSELYRVEVVESVKVYVTVTADSVRQALERARSGEGERSDPVSYGSEVVNCIEVEK